MFRIRLESFNVCFAEEKKTKVIWITKFCPKLNILSLMKYLKMIIINKQTKKEWLWFTMFGIHVSSQYLISHLWNVLSHNSDFLQFWVYISAIAYELKIVRNNKTRG